jgi:hypothetical protein
MARFADWKGGGVGKGRAREAAEKFTRHENELVDSHFPLRFFCALLSSLLSRSSKRRATKSKSLSNRSSVTSNASEKGVTTLYHLDKNLEMIKAVLRVTAELSKIEGYCESLNEFKLQSVLVDIIKRSGIS